MNKDKFLECLNKNKTNTNGIGTYKEKTLHWIIKNYYESDETKQEVSIGNYVADICNDNNIIEIQTRAFNKLVHKLDYFLLTYKVKIIYPIAYEKWISWIDPITGEITSKRRSPKKGNIYDSFYELYKIKRFLNNKNCKIVLLFLNIDEYRNLNGWNETKKRGSSRENQVPFEIVDEIEIDNFDMFIPKELNYEFTSNDYSKLIKRNIRIAQLGLNILQYLKVVEVVRKESRKNIYKKS